MMYYIYIYLYLNNIFYICNRSANRDKKNDTLFQHKYLNKNDIESFLI